MELSLGKELDSGTIFWPAEYSGFVQFNGLPPNSAVRCGSRCEAGADSDNKNITAGTKQKSNFSGTWQNFAK